MEGTTVHELRVDRTARVLVRGDTRSARETWILLHGYAQLASELLDACGPLAADGRLLVAPEALSRFYRRGSSGPIGASWMTREAREAEIRDNLGYLERVAAWCERELGARSGPPVVFGFSQGSAAAWRWAALGSTRPRRLVTWGSGIPHELDLAPARDRLTATRIEIVHGRRDAHHTTAVVAHDRERLALAGLDATVHEFDGGHELAPDVLAQLGAG